ncbi:MAG: hypothetical protein A2Y62_19640 [Candidatus Fischerbacteria bacterium RBG_13_37_8]|uniref:DUF3160 domain-containing protein n=1 Tax=Candidatus Fischerbacteria bacterium RBG_13_37_8 TaxID=1817863 RepID=A0A1F5V9G8_9BACT|nr:MAG: hypothetical protein A2Y62_19640 [Candidatus Fischerbacteria bacterium RBG_13_37_8]
MYRKKVLYGIAAAALVLLYCIFGCTLGKREPLYTAGKINEPVLSYNPPKYSFMPKQYDNEEYALPLKKLPENYERDIMRKFGKELSAEQKAYFLRYGVVILPGENDRFEHAYKKLNEAKNYQVDGQWQYDESGVPIVITTDSVMHLFHIEFNELLKNIEIQKLTPMLNELLTSAIGASQEQYKNLGDPVLKELSRRNIAYLAVAEKLLDAEFKIPRMVKDDVEHEMKMIEEHKGFFKNELFSKDCPEVCSERLYPKDMEYRCSQEVKGKVMYEGKEWEFADLYTAVCLKSCYCEDYSQYVPRGHYTASEGLKRYFKAMMWLGRMTFKANGAVWTKQAILLTDAVKTAKVSELWKKIYTVTGFFAGASDDLTFYEYDAAVFKAFNYGFNQDVELKKDVTDKIREELSKLRGPKILGGFEFDLVGNLKDTTQGLRLIGQRYAIDSHILSDMVYNNVGVNPASEHYKRVVGCKLTTQQLSEPAEFYNTCANMEKDKVKYWNEVSSKAMEMYYYGYCEGMDEQQLYNVVRFMPSGLDIMSAMGSKRADELMAVQNMSTYCDYTEKIKEMKKHVKSYDQGKWAENLYNTWLWMIQPVLFEKPKGYPNWMRTQMWQNKELITSLASWAQLRHDTILYVKQSYTRAVMMLKPTSAMPEPMESKYYGYVEPNPELYARAHFIVQYLLQGLEEQGVMTESVKNSLEQSKEMMLRLQQISEKELEGELLSEDDYNYIENIDKTFNRIIEDLASALKIEGEKPSGPTNTHTNLEGKDDAFKATIIADVHTETNTKKVLEVGTGKIDWVIISHASKDGRVGIAVGPMFSYYEFPHPMDDRLTDEKWRKLLDEKLPSRPPWFSLP